MKYERPASTFCATYHESSNRYLGPHPYGKPKSKTTARVLKILTSLSSICVQRPGEVIATAAYFDGSAGGRAVILCAGNGDVPTATREFLVKLMVRLHGWYHEKRLSNPNERDAAVIELASMILSFQAERWTLRLHDNPKDRAVWDARLTAVRAAVGTKHAVGFDALNKAIEDIRNHARGFSKSGPLDESVEDAVRRLLQCEQLLASSELRAVLEVADGPFYSGFNIQQMVDPSQHLVIDDVDKLEDACGHLIPSFSLTRYFINITAVVRYARHFVDFTAGDRMLFHAPEQQFDFCDFQHVLNEHGGIEWEWCPHDDRTHVGMRILQALCERTEPGKVKLIPAVGSSAPLCSACYNAFTGVLKVRDLPSAFNVRLGMFEFIVLKLS